MVVCCRWLCLFAVVDVGWCCLMLLILTLWFAVDVGCCCVTLMLFVVVANVLCLMCVGRCRCLLLCVMVVGCCLLFVVVCCWLSLCVCGCGCSSPLFCGNRLVLLVVVCVVVVCCCVCCCCVLSPCAVTFLSLFVAVCRCLQRVEV